LSKLQWRVEGLRGVGHLSPYPLANKARLFDDNAETSLEFIYPSVDDTWLDLSSKFKMSVLAW
jgi:hypothetical protein